MVQQYANVGEHWPLYDTVLIGVDSRGDDPQVPGWYPTLAALGAANRMFFFNQRTRANGLAYCNLDVRDQMPYGFRIYSGGCRFFASSMTEALNPDDTANWWTSNYVPHIFSVDLFRHCDFTLRVQQDDILKTTAALVPPGYGPSGGGVGRGQISGQFVAAVDNCYSVVSQSHPNLDNRWKFPNPIEVPRNAALSVEMIFSEYGRQLLQAMVKQRFQDSVTGNGHAEDQGNQSKTYYGIQVCLVGERLVQQRGQYHRG